MFAGAMADESARIILGYWRRQLEVIDKADSSPVTIADRQAEAAMRAMIEARYPEHGIAGEEYGRSRLDAEYVWSLDPVDGTKAFISGSPLFGTLIALLHHNDPVLGIINIPATGERWIGGAGLEARMNGTPLRTRTGVPLKAAISGSTSPSMFVGQDEARIARLHERIKQPVWGGDCYLYGLLTLGTLDLVVEAGMSDYDYLAPAAVVRAAGGVITGWQGEALGIASTDRIVAAGDPALHREVIRLLNEG